MRSFILATVLGVSALITWVIVADPTAYKQCIVVVEDESFELSNCKRVGRHGMKCEGIEFPFIEAAICQ